MSSFLFSGKISRSLSKRSLNSNEEKEPKEKLRDIILSDRFPPHRCGGRSRKPAALQRQIIFDSEAQEGRKKRDSQ
jgi:hypothetical protein